MKHVRNINAFSLGERRLLHMAPGEQPQHQPSGNEHAETLEKFPAAPEKIKDQPAAAAEQGKDVQKATAKIDTVLKLVPDFKKFLTPSIGTLITPLIGTRGTEKGESIVKEQLQQTKPMETQKQPESQSEEPGTYRELLRKDMQGGMKALNEATNKSAPTKQEQVERFAMTMAILGKIIRAVLELLKRSMNGTIDQKINKDKAKDTQPETAPQQKSPADQVKEEIVQGKDKTPEQARDAAKEVAEKSRESRESNEEEITNIDKRIDALQKEESAMSLREQDIRHEITDAKQEGKPTASLESMLTDVTTRLASIRNTIKEQVALRDTLKKDNEDLRKKIDAAQKIEKDMTEAINDLVPVLKQITDLLARMGLFVAISILIDRLLSPTFMIRSDDQDIAKIFRKEPKDGFIALKPDDVEEAARKEPETEAKKPQEKTETPAPADIQQTPRAPDVKTENSTETHEGIPAAMDTFVSQMNEKIQQGDEPGARRILNELNAEVAAYIARNPDAHTMELFDFQRKAVERYAFKDFESDTFTFGFDGKEFSLTKVIPEKRETQPTFSFDLARLESDFTNAKQTLDSLKGTADRHLVQIDAYIKQFTQTEDAALQALQRDSSSFDAEKAKKNDYVIRIGQMVAELHGLKGDTADGGKKVA